MPSRPATFRPSHLGSPAEARKASDQRRGSARERGYTAQWDKEATAYKRAHPLCLGCEAVGRVEPTTVVDHIDPHKGDMVKFWAREMWQPSCDFHHDAVKKRLEDRYAKGEATLSDLRLDSRMAIELTLLLQG